MAHHAAHDVERCIKNCLDCHSVCMRTVRHCVEKGGAYADPGLIRLLMDCSEICQLSAHFLLNGSDFHERICALAADISGQAAKSAERFDQDPFMRECAHSCRVCVESCRQIAAPIAA